MQLNWSLRRSWSIALRRCSKYVFIPDLKLCKDNWKTRNNYALGFGAPYIWVLTVNAASDEIVGNSISHMDIKGGFCKFISTFRSPKSSLYQGWDGVNYSYC